MLFYWKRGLGQPSAPHNASLQEMHRGFDEPQPRPYEVQRRYGAGHRLLKDPDEGLAVVGATTSGSTAGSYTRVTPETVRTR